MNRKWCPRCREMLPRGRFNLDRRRRDGRRSWCRTCEREDWDRRAAGIRPIAPPDDERLFGPRLVCTCPTAVIDWDNAGACECGLPIVATMRPHNQQAMDAKWPQWREQTVINPNLQDTPA